MVFGAQPDDAETGFCADGQRVAGQLAKSQCYAGQHQGLPNQLSAPARGNASDVSYDFLLFVTEMSCAGNESRRVA